MIRAVEPWLATPLACFVRDAGLRCALVLEPSGRVLAAHGFTRSVDVMSACALAAGIHATATELGRLVQGDPYGALHYRGAASQLFLSPLLAGDRLLVVLAVFDDESSLGVVRVCFSDLAASALATRSAAEAPAAPLDADFERELGKNLAVLFGRT
ncbi:MAG TPA: roadblock/LC7 domain-containing protein [Gemmatimonadaceae bacterium]|nr:roadblock/LC7 domain-containing protein [Gemmatimonadaceae bacterium]